MITLTNRQARQFMLLKQGLIGAHRFTGKQGVLDFVRQAGCIQFDPVDVCGRNADIVLNSRVEGYKKEILDELLYKDRRLVDFFDKNLSIFPVEDLPVFLRYKPGGSYAAAYDTRCGDSIKRIEPTIRRLIHEQGHISAKEINVNETIEWHWSIMTSLSRAALESMYFRGELIIHHKNGTNKSYAFMNDHIPAEILHAALPYTTEEERLAWHIKRRIGAVGMLWNKAGDAFLGLSLKSAERTAAFSKLLNDGMIFEIAVDGLKDLLYCCSEDLPLIDEVLRNAEQKPRCELIAPLDSFIWDRKLIKALFGFEYTWEIYTPAVKRKYGGYVLPVLYGEQFAARVELVCERKTGTMKIKNIWFEDCVKQTKKLHGVIDACLKRFAGFNECESMQYMA